MDDYFFLLRGFSISSFGEIIFQFTLFPKFNLLKILHEIHNTNAKIKEWTNATVNLLPFRGTLTNTFGDKIKNRRALNNATIIFIINYVYIITKYFVWLVLLFVFPKTIFYFI
jgi:hypothetical protein